jgi:hypothetical protein
MGIVVSRRPAQRVDRIFDIQFLFKMTMKSIQYALELRKVEDSIDQFPCYFEENGLNHLAILE